VQRLKKLLLYASAHFFFAFGRSTRSSRNSSGPLGRHHGDRSRRRVFAYKFQLSEANPISSIAMILVTPFFPDLALYRTVVRNADISQNDRPRFRRCRQATPWPRRIARTETQARHQFEIGFAIGCLEYRSSISRQLPATPMSILARSIKLPNVAPVQCPHDADASEHRWPSERSDQDQGFHRRLPFHGLVLGLRQLGDVVAGVLKRDQQAAAGQRYRIVERSFPAHLGSPSAGTLDRLAQPFHGELDIFRLQVALALDLGLVPIFREALKIFLSEFPGGRALPGELLADDWVFGHWPRRVSAGMRAIEAR
jgi:hypothetical protein